MLTLLAYSYLLLYVAMGLVLFIPGLLLQFGKEKRSSKNISSDLNDLTVIIPFRNELQNLEKLLLCFESSEKMPGRVILVNDHSEDNSYSFLDSNLKDERFKILDLPEHIQGKKEAIRYALKLVQSKFVLTMDADILFSEIYFTALEKLEWKALHVLPVNMIAHSFFGRLAEMDHLLVNAINVCGSGWVRPFIASGANLLFRKDSFETYDQFELHKHIPSGDDTYLLRDFRNAKARVELHSAPELSVETNLPESLGKFLAQRIRWAAKTGDVNDRMANGIVLLQALLTLWFVLLLAAFFLRNNWSGLLFVWAAKTIMDVLFFLPFFLRVKRVLTLIWMPLYELIYPFYSLTIALTSLSVRPKWKGRRIRVR